MLLVPYADERRKGLIVDIETRKPLNGVEISKRLGLRVQGINPILKALVKHNALIELKASRHQKHMQE